MEAELFHLDRRTDTTTLTVAFRNVANAPKTVLIFDMWLQKVILSAAAAPTSVLRDNLFSNKNSEQEF
jgi:hypothetical protein